jgi:hypothetical protein
MNWVVWHPFIDYCLPWMALSSFWEVVCRDLTNQSNHPMDWLVCRLVYCAVAHWPSSTRPSALRRSTWNTNTHDSTLSSRRPRKQLKTHTLCLDAVWSLSRTSWIWVTTPTVQPTKNKNKKWIDHHYRYGGGQWFAHISFRDSVRSPSTKNNSRYKFVSTVSQSIQDHRSVDLMIWWSDDQSTSQPVNLSTCGTLNNSYQHSLGFYLTNIWLCCLLEHRWDLL